MSFFCGCSGNGVCSYILVQILLLRREFKPVNLFQIVFSTIFGYFVNFTKWMVGDFLLPGGYAGRLAMQCIGIVFVAFGVFLYPIFSFPRPLSYPLLFKIVFMELFEINWK